MIRPNILNVSEIGGFPYAAESRLMNIWMDACGKAKPFPPWSEIEENTHAL